MTARIQATPRRRRRTFHHPTLNTPTNLQRVHPSTSKPVAIAWSPSGTYLAVATQHGPIFLFYVLTAKKHVIRSNPIRTFRGHGADVLYMSFSHSDFLLSASMDRTVRLWHADANVCLRTFLHPDMVTTVAFHPKDHNFVLSAGCDGVLRVWRLSDHACIAHADVGAVVTTAQFDADGNRAFVGTYDGRVLVLDVKHLSERPAEDVTNSPVNSDTSRDDNNLVSSQATSDNIGPASSLVAIKSASIRQRRSRRKSPGPKVRGMCVRTNRKQMAVVSSDARVHVFGKEGDVVDRLKAGIRREGTVPLGSSLSPDGRYILHDAVGGVLRILDLSARQKQDSSRRRERDVPVGVESLQIVMEGNVSCAAFAPAGVLNNMRPGRDNSDRYVMAVGVDDGSLRIVECASCR